MWTRLTSLFKPQPAEPKLAPGVTVYAIGDIHGRADLLEDLLGKIQADAAPENENTLIFVGDYIDRGPHSAAVVERVSALDWPGWTIIRLKGNHEQALLDFLSNPETYQQWRNFGAPETLWSYGVKPPSFSNAASIYEAQEAFRVAFPRHHLAFFMDLKESYSVGGYFFAHAGVRPGIALERQVAGDLLWIRDEFLLSEEDFGKVVVHGHSPSERPIRRSNRIGIDTGAYVTNVLTAVKLSGDAVSFLSASIGQ
ncbi:serine/threonine protein phosphatase 1 [Rhizomicrobium palustre]|uniref:Serine/threonine protein phosphatase 1 n=1 Tax=Rhizomicrobium palustre TaxID=189966 RepID=A0A846MU65_9PROT|nr:serine/threonine protein phosphatase 1 [Rhizomicrobium palustre]